MTQEKIHKFFQRIDNLAPGQKPSFGTMNVHQMVCHCTDQIRLALGTFEASEYGALKPKEVFAFYNKGLTVPTPKGLDQVKGEGTKPTTFENDTRILKENIIEFSNLDENFEFGKHPYFGQLNKEKWISLTIYHLDYHLKQFGV